MKVAIIPARGETRFICQSAPVDDATDTANVDLICNTIVTIAIVPRNRIISAIKQLLSAFILLTITIIAGNYDNTYAFFYC